MTGLAQRQISDYGGVAVMPVYASMFIVFTLASIGLPATNRFYRRVSDYPWRVQGESMGRRACQTTGIIMKRRLYALALPEGIFHGDKPEGCWALPGY